MPFAKSRAPGMRRILTDAMRHCVMAGALLISADLVWSQQPRAKDGVKATTPAAKAPEALAPVKAAVQALEGRRLRVGCTKSAISHIDEREALLGLRVLLRSVADHEDLRLDPPRIFADERELSAAVQQGQIDVFLTTGIHFARMSAAFPVTALITPSTEERSADVLELITNNRRKAKDLAGKKLVITTGGWGDTPRLWLEQTLQSQALPPSDRHFAEVAESPSPLRSILRVFYGKCDSAVVPRQAFRRACAQNPQIEQRIHVAEMSQPLVQMVFGVSQTMAQQRPDLAKIIVNKARQTNEGDTLRQILCGETGQLIEFQAASLRDTVALATQGAASMLARSQTQTPAGSGAKSAPLVGSATKGGASAPAVSTLPPKGRLPNDTLDSPSGPVPGPVPSPKKPQSAGQRP